ncbi:MAG: hypothetical protein AAGJ87_08455, partial [Pseudomonadota bacterium]
LLEFNPGGTGPDPVLNGVVLELVDAGNDTFAGDGATLFGAATNSTTFTSGTAADSTLTAPTGFVTPLVPGANEQSVTPADPSAIDSDLEAAAYVGAVEDASDLWFAGWTLGL